MAKRFADTEKYKKPFIRALPAAYKLLWDYICLDCNHAGVWQKDFQIAQIYIGADAQVTEQEALRLFNQGEERIVVLNHGSRWFIKPFIEFQYGNLNPKNRVHASILERISREGVKPLASPLNGAMEKEEDKDKEMDKEKEEDGKKKFNQLEAFNSVACKYPVQIGSSAAMRFFFESVIDDEKFSLFKIALDKYLASKRVKDGFVLDFNKWIINWSDWVNHKEPVKEETSAERDARILAKFK